MILDLPSWTLQEFFLSSIWHLFFSLTGPKVCAAWVAPTFVDSSGAASFVHVCIPEYLAAADSAWPNCPKETRRIYSKYMPRGLAFHSMGPRYTMKYGI